MYMNIYDLIKGFKGELIELSQGQSFSLIVKLFCFDKQRIHQHIEPLTVKENGFNVAYPFVTEHDGFLVVKNNIKIDWNTRMVHSDG